MKINQDQLGIEIICKSDPKEGYIIAYGLNKQVKLENLNISPEIIQEYIYLT